MEGLLVLLLCAVVFCYIWKTVGSVFSSVRGRKECRRRSCREERSRAESYHGAEEGVNDLVPGKEGEYIEFEEVEPTDMT